MLWNAERQQRFDELRLAELSRRLNDAELAELAALTSMLEADEIGYLAPAVTQIQAEQHQLQSQLVTLQNENADLAQLLRQQQQLVADARQWLMQFEQRHRAIRRLGSPTTSAVK